MIREIPNHHLYMYVYMYMNQRILGKPQEIGEEFSSREYMKSSEILVGICHQDSV